jgi:hypothetical protein
VHTWPAPPLVRPDFGVRYFRELRRDFRRDFSGGKPGWKFGGGSEGNPAGNARPVFRRHSRHERSRRRRGGGGGGSFCRRQGGGEALEERDDSESGVKCGVKCVLLWRKMCGVRIGVGGEWGDGMTGIDSDERDASDERDDSESGVKCVLCVYKVNWVVGGEGGDILA